MSLGSLGEKALAGYAAFLNKWFASATDAGVMFAERAFVTLAGYKIGLPVAISLAARRRVKIEDNEGLRDTIKFITKTTSTQITLAGAAANWRVARPSPLPSIPGVPRKLQGLAQGAITQVAQSILPSDIGLYLQMPTTDEYVNKVKMLGELYGILRKADAPLEIIDEEGLLAGHGINFVVPTDFSEMPMAHVVAWRMTLAVDYDADPLELLFPEEEKEQAE